MKKNENLFIEASDANEGTVVNNRTTFEDWFVHDDFASKNVKIADKSKAYIEELIGKNKNRSWYTKQPLEDKQQPLLNI